MMRKVTVKDLKRGMEVMNTLSERIFIFGHSVQSDARVGGGYDVYDISGKKIGTSGSKVKFMILKSNGE